MHLWPVTLVIDPTKWPGAEGKVGITTVVEWRTMFRVPGSFYGAKAGGRLVPDTGPVTGGVVPVGIGNGAGLLIFFIVKRVYWELCGGLLWRGSVPSSCGDRGFLICRVRATM